MTTGLRYTFEISGQNSNVFELVEFEGNETISVPFEYRVTLYSETDDLNPDDMVDERARLTVWKDDEPVQFLHGIVSSFQIERSGFYFSQYRLTLVPEIARLALRFNSRIFQEQSIQDIIEMLLGEMGIEEYAFFVNRALLPREYCVQYRETDLAFIQRLAAEEGLFFFHEHVEDKCKLIFIDDTQSLNECEAPLLLNENPGGTADQPYLREFSFRKHVTNSSVQMKDYSFKNPPYSLLHESVATDVSHQRDTYEYYQAYGRFKDDESGQPFTRIRMEYLTRDAHWAQAKGNVTGLVSGLRFDLEGHEQDCFNRKWTIITLYLKGTQAASKGAEAMGTPTTFESELCFIPGDRPWQAKPHERPRVDGPQIATVVGPAGEEIYCDEHGRVKVQFPWDRYAEGDENSSCWVRVSQGWAGVGYGMITIPRIGHEVIVSFLEGDPDQPIITGRTYHAINHAPYPLPDNKTRSLIKTDSHKADGSNEIRFEDAGGEEEVYIHAQKDQKNVVKNNETTSVGANRSENVGHDETISIGNDRKETVGNDETIEIANNRTTTIGNDETITVGNNETITIGSDRTETVVKNETVQIGMNRDKKVGSNDTLYVGGNQAETILIAKAESVGAAKALTVGAGYQITVAASKNESVGLTSTEQVGMLKQVVAGKRYEVICGESKLVLNADGTIMLVGKKVAISGAKHVEVDGKLVEIN